MTSALRERRSPLIRDHLRLKSRSVARGTRPCRGCRVRGRSRGRERPRQPPRAPSYSSRQSQASLNMSEMTPCGDSEGLGARALDPRERCDSGYYDANRQAGDRVGLWFYARLAGGSLPEGALPSTTVVVPATLSRSRLSACNGCPAHPPNGSSARSYGPRPRTRASPLTSSS
jgi:hypothetical protein